MKKIKITLLAVILPIATMSSVLHAGWIHQENSVYVGKEAVEKHPAMHEQKIVMPIDSESALICIAYANSTKRSAKARISTLVTIEDLEGNQETRTISVRVRKHTAVKCTAAMDLSVGDLITFEQVFQKFPRLRSSADSKQGVGITGLVSTAGKPSIGAGPLALAPASGTTPLGLVHSGKSGWFHSANSVFHGEKKNQEHPGSIIRAIVMPVDSASKPLVCSGYSRVSDDKGQGRVVTSATIGRSDGTIERLALNGRVRKNQHLKCKKASQKILQGDIVTFESEFQDMPVLAKSAFADLVGAVTSTGEPSFRTEGADEPSDPGGPAPGNILSTADEHAITRLMRGGLSKNKLVRPKGNQPAKYLIVGPKTRLDANGDRVLSTVGLGGTPAVALADYEKKQGSIGGQAKLLNSKDRDAYEWFSRMNSAGGPTNIKGFTSGAIGAEVFRPSLGSRVSGPLSSATAAVNFLKKLGL